MILVDATTLYDLGMVGELELLDELGELVIPQAVVDQITVEPAATNLERFLAEFEAETAPETGPYEDDARSLLGDRRPDSDVALVAALLAGRDDEASPLGFVSDDRRLRAIADGLGATITGTFGVVVRAAATDKYFSPTQAKRVVRRLDGHGLQSTGPLRARTVGELGDS